MTSYNVTKAQAETPAALPTLILAKKGNHAKLGETVEIRAGGKTIASAVCVYRGKIVATPIAIRRVLEPTFQLSAGNVLDNLLKAAEQGSFQAAEHVEKAAAAAGFERWAQVFDHQALKPSKADTPLEMTREVIGLAYKAEAAG